jgi:hypothetical protein
MLGAKQERTMQVHIFRGPDRIFGFSRDETGQNLPARYNPWTHFKAVEINKGEPATSFNTDDCLADIEAYGYHLTDSHVRIAPDEVA